LARQQHYLTLHPEHEELAVEVDFAALSAFGRCEPGLILHADLQSSYGYQSPLRLGSGRSGYHNGYYLKGIGRTSLAGNWMNSIDVYHGTGHLCASAAAREYLVTVFLKARGLEQSIVPCEGLLVRPLDSRLHGFGEQAFSPHERTLGDLMPADRHLQAITVKPGRFLRLSHLTWYLNHPPGPGFLRCFLEGLVEATASRKEVASLSPDGIVQIIEEVLEQGIENFLAFFRNGIFWGSTHNNFAADGRFLDLELPTLLGGPFYGFTTMPQSPPSPDEFIPLPGEVWDFVLQIRSFTSLLISRLSHFVRENRWFFPNERIFARELLTHLEEWQLTHEVNGLFTVEGLIERVASYYRQWGLATAEEDAQKLLPYLHFRAASLPGLDASKLILPPLKSIEVQHPQIEPFHRRQFWAEHDQDLRHTHSISYLHEHLEQLDRCTQPDEYLQRLRLASHDILERETLS
jgi:hypothetical protein